MKIFFLALKINFHKKKINFHGKKISFPGLKKYFETVNHPIVNLQLTKTMELWNKYLFHTS